MVIDLFHAVHTVDGNAIRRFVLDEDVDINSIMNDKTPLIVAIINSSLPMVELLLELGALTDVRTGRDGVTALHVCARNPASLSMMGLLLQHGAPINLQTTKLKLTPLHYSMYSLQVENINFLVENGADVNLRDVQGDSPLQHAIKDPVLRESSYRGLNKYVLQKTVIGILLDYGAESETGLDSASDEIKGFIRHYVLNRERQAEPRNPILEKTVMNVISQEETTVSEHLRADPRNFAIVHIVNEEEHIALTSTADVHHATDEAIAFPCHQGNNSTAPRNVDTTTEMLKLLRISGFGGYVSVASLMEAMSQVIDTNTRIFRLVEDREVVSAVSQTYLEGRTNGVSVTHCPPGPHANLYKLEPMQVEGVPLSAAIADDFVHADNMSLVTMAYTIVKNATTNSTALDQLASKIMAAGESIMVSRHARSAQFQERVRNRILVIEGDVDIKLLLNWIHLFRPRLSGVKVTATVPITDDISDNTVVAGIDLSFVRHIVGLQSFVSTHPLLNSRSVWHQLLHHAGTLTLLSMYANKPRAPNMAVFVVLSHVTLKGVDGGSVFSRVKELPSLKSLEIQCSSWYTGDVDGLQPARGTESTLTKLVLKFPRFYGSLRPISNLISLVELDLDLPGYRGGFQSLSTLTNLRTLKVRSAQPFDLDTSRMSIANLDVLR